MATALIEPAAPTASAAPSHAGGSPTNPMVVALTTAMACVAVVWVTTAVLLLIMTPATVWGAIGVGAYAAFWLGGGFGAIFGSAAVSGRDH